MSKKNQNNDNSNDEEFVFEEDIDHKNFSNPTKKLEKLKKELDEVKKEKTNYLNGWQRAQADYHNLKTQVAKEKENTIKYAKESLIEDLIPLADSFEMAWSNKEAWEQAPLNWRQGIEYIYKDLKSILKNNNVEEIDPRGEPFNPLEHEAIESVTVEDEKEDDIVLDVVKKGYKINDKIIRPAQVKVGNLNN